MAGVKRESETFPFGSAGHLYQLEELTKHHLRFLRAQPSVKLRRQERNLDGGVSRK